jgi:16S rRNA (adenine1518-N6/adenine1519-N6)-dimethyltransferase
MLTPQELVHAYQRRTKKQFGQHFLTDAGILESIADSIGLKPGEHVLEIGPGCGTLTSIMIAREAHVRAVEIDRDAADFLTEQFVNDGQLDLIRGDALRVDFSDVLAGVTRWKCAANLPYNVGTPIFFELTKYRQHFDVLALMFQKEVAQRMVATPKDKKRYGALSLMTQLYHEAHIHMKLPPGAFLPPPKVDSALVVLHPIVESRIPDDALRALFKRVVKTAFQQRRKTLSNSLKTLCVDKATLQARLEIAEVPLTERPERVDFDGFVRIAQALAPVAV